MPVNTDFTDANDASRPLKRVTCDLKDEEERKAFLDSLEMAIMMQPPVGLIYIASIDVSQNDRAAAEHIAWLRANAYSIDSTPKDLDIVGALGEWALLRSLALHPSVMPVSLVSLAPESKPDFAVKYTGFNALFDIKTTASTLEPRAYMDPAHHEKKGTPHVIGICLRDEWQSAKSADIFFGNAKFLMTTAEYEKYCAIHNSRPQPVFSLKGNLTDI